MSAAVQVYATRSWTNIAGLSNGAEHYVGAWWWWTSETAWRSNVLIELTHLTTRLSERNEDWGEDKWMGERWKWIWLGSRMAQEISCFFSLLISRHDRIEGQQVKGFYQIPHFKPHIFLNRADVAGRLWDVCFICCCYCFIRPPTFQLD